MRGQVRSFQTFLTFHTDATIFRCHLEAGRKTTFDRTKERRIFSYLTKGFLSVNGQQIAEADQARVDVEEPLVLAAKQVAEFILIDLPSQIPSLDFISIRVKLPVYCNTEVCYGKKISI